MPGQKTLLVNPPPINGIRFTRQGRCQEREEVLGTTKPPYSLLVTASLLRARGLDFRLIDMTAANLTTAQVIAKLDAEQFKPDLIVFCSTTPTLDADVAEMAKLREKYQAPIISFGPHASAAPQASMARATKVDGMLIGEPEDAIVALAGRLTPDRLASIPSLTYRLDETTVPHKAQGVFTGFANMPFPAWDLVPLAQYRCRSKASPTSSSRPAALPYSCDFCVAPIHQGHKFRERDAKAIVDEIERATKRARRLATSICGAIPSR